MGSVFRRVAALFWAFVGVGVLFFFAAICAWPFNTTTYLYPSMHDLFPVGLLLCGSVVAICAYGLFLIFAWGVDPTQKDTVYVGVASGVCMAGALLGLFCLLFGPAYALGALVLTLFAAAFFGISYIYGRTND